MNLLDEGDTVSSHAAVRWFDRDMQWDSAIPRRERHDHDEWPRASIDTVARDDDDWPLALLFVSDHVTGRLLEPYLTAFRHGGAGRRREVRDSPPRRLLPRIATAPRGSGYAPQDPP